MEVVPQSESNKTHILIFPLPMQGPVNSMIKLAELLIISSTNLHITFLTTDVVYRHLLLSARARARFDHNQRFSLRVFSDGLPDDHPRGGDEFVEMVDAVKVVGQRIVKEMVSLEGNDNITGIVSDGLYDFALDVGNEVGIPVYYFETMSPSCLWVYFCLPKLIEAGELPFTESNDLDTLVNVPGMSDYIRRRDLPDFCRCRDETDNMMVQRVLAQVKQFRRANGIILNSFEALDSHLLAYIRSHCRNLPIYTVGPLHLNLKERLQEKAALFDQAFISCDHSNSFLQEDRSCISWLDKQPPKSVILCSFGSQVVITKDQLMEFWHGLVDSGVLFLWVRRPGSVIGMDDDYEVLKEKNLIHIDLVEGIDKRGCIVSWAPQVEVLSHQAIGGFLTHGGWNSIMESVAAGVPMICWPRYVDQLVNSRLVTKVWKVGVDMKDICNRVTVEQMVRDVMNLRKDELLANATNLAKSANQSVVHEGGSSYGSIQSLVNGMKSFIKPL